MGASVRVWGAFAAHAIVLCATYLHLVAPRLRSDLDWLLAVFIAAGSLVVTIPLNAVIAQQVSSLILRLVCIAGLCVGVLVFFTGVGFLKSNTSLVLAALAASLVHQLIYSPQPETTESDCSSA